MKKHSALLYIAHDETRLRMINRIHAYHCGGGEREKPNHMRRGVRARQIPPCPGQCSGHGECLGARCFCAPGWRGAACEEAAPEANSGCHVSLPQAILAQVPFAILGLGVGWGIRFAAAERQRAKMREILQEDAQRPFASQ